MQTERAGGQTPTFAFLLVLCDLWTERAENGRACSALDLMSSGQLFMAAARTLYPHSGVFTADFHRGNLTENSAAEKGRGALSWETGELTDIS